MIVLVIVVVVVVVHRVLFDIRVYVLVVYVSYDMCLYCAPAMSHNTAMMFVFIQFLWYV